MSTQLWWPFSTSFCTKSCWKFCGLRSSPDLGTPGDRLQWGGHWSSMEQLRMKPMSIYATAKWLTFNIDLCYYIINILQLESFHTVCKMWDYFYAYKWMTCTITPITPYIFENQHGSTRISPHCIQSQRLFSKCWKVSAPAASQEDSSWMSRSFLVFKLESRIEGNWRRYVRDLTLKRFYRLCLRHPNVSPNHLQLVNYPQHPTSESNL